MEAKKVKGYKEREVATNQVTKTAMKAMCEVKLKDKNTQQRTTKAWA